MASVAEPEVQNHIESPRIIANRVNSYCKVTSLHLTARAWIEELEVEGSTIAMIREMTKWIGEVGGDGSVVLPYSNRHIRVMIFVVIVGVKRNCCSAQHCIWVGHKKSPLCKLLVEEAGS